MTLAEAEALLPHVVGTALDREAGGLSTPG